MSDVPSVYRWRAGRTGVVILGAALIILLVAVGLFAATGCREFVNASVAPVAATCYRYVDLPESQQVASACQRRVSGWCSTTPTLCIAFAFAHDINSSAVAPGYIGSPYYCVDVACSESGGACRCDNPAIQLQTSFCVRSLAGGNATFACHD